MPDELTVTPPMTGEQFAWHLVGVLHLFDHLQGHLVSIANTMPAVCRTEAEARVARLVFPLDPSALVGSDVTSEDISGCVIERADKLLGWIKSIEYEDDITKLVLGPDWRVVGVEHRNAAAIAYRLGAIEPARAKNWYVGITSLITASWGTIRAELNHELRLAQIDVDFWTQVEAAQNWPLNLMGAVLEALGKFAAGVADAAGGAAGSAFGGILTGLWKAVKPLIIPGLIVGGGAVLVMHNKDRIKGYISGKEPEAKSESVGRVRFRRPSG